MPLTYFSGDANGSEEEGEESEDDDDEEYAEQSSSVGSMLFMTVAFPKRRMWIID